MRCITLKINDFMNIVRKILTYIKYPKKILVYALNKFSAFIPDKQFLQWKFYLLMGQKLDLNNPKTFNEKLQWLKLYNRNPKYTTMVDKYAVKEYVAKKLG